MRLRPSYRSGNDKRTGGNTGDSRADEERGIHVVRTLAGGLKADISHGDRSAKGCEHHEGRPASVGRASGEDEAGED
jgi:hypothetical protein